MIVTANTYRIIVPLRMFAFHVYDPGKEIGGAKTLPMLV